METFVNISRAASDDTLSKLDSHLEALMEILAPRFTSHRFHCFTYLALHTMEAIVSDEIIRRNNERQMARQMADAYIEMEQHASEEGGGLQLNHHQSPYRYTSAYILIAMPCPQNR